MILLNEDIVNLEILAYGNFINLAVGEVMDYGKAIEKFGNPFNSSSFNEFAKQCSAMLSC